MLRSHIDLIDYKTGTPVSSAPEGKVLLSSEPLEWKGIKVELHQFSDFEMEAHFIKEHRMIINVSHPVQFEWKSAGAWKTKRYEYGAFALQTDGDFHQPRWFGPFHFLSFAFDPAFVNKLVEKDFGGQKVEFVEQRGLVDATILEYGKLFRQELQQGKYAGKLYGETLTIAFVLQLLSQYSAHKIKLQPPKGKLSSNQLKHVLDYTQAHLCEELSLETMAEEINLSPFHFSRLFKNTAGYSLHQFILGLKIERAKSLIRKRTLSLTEVALLTGFYDQSHFIHTFKRAVGVSPKLFAKMV
jgi:AraC family transcriptional regulator